ncbi:MAG: hypothetical protein K8W52_12985 [Deltaproteobacteria bacterium]|nr:hypothetical protein [Deltaproteobacteria bacterium]
MRSNGLARLLGALAISVAASACVIGAPPGFSSGDSWSFPLVGPLEDGVLVTAVFVNDKGPYLFAIDPDAPLSSVDAGLVGELDLYASNAGRYLDEADRGHPTRMAEVKSFRLGNLTVRNRKVFATEVGVFAFNGRQIRGVLGRDVIADSLVFGFDRDAGMGYLATKKGFVVPQGAITIGYDNLAARMESDVLPVSRRLTTASIGGHNYDMHIDLGAVQSQLRPGLWKEAQLSAVPQTGSSIDEFGTRRVTNAAGVAGPITIGALTVPAGEALLPYDDRRWEEQSIDGTIGLGAFRDYGVWADWDREKVLLVRRAPDTAQTIKGRIDRWGSAVLTACAQPGCVDIKLEPSGAPPAEAPGGDVGGPAPTERRRGAVVQITRDPLAKELNLEAVVEAVDASGARVPNLPRLIVTLPTGVDTLTEGLDPSFDGSILRVVDVSPFVRTCPNGGGCIFQLAAP